METTLWNWLLLDIQYNLWTMPHALRCDFVVEHHYSVVMMNSMASQITGVSVVYPTVCSGPDQRSKHRQWHLRWGIHRLPVNLPQKGSLARKIFPFDDVIISTDLTILFIPTENCDIITANRSTTKSPVCLMGHIVYMYDTNFIATRLTEVGVSVYIIIIL